MAVTLLYLGRGSLGKSWFLVLFSPSWRHAARSHSNQQPATSKAEEPLTPSLQHADPVAGTAGRPGRKLAISGASQHWAGAIVTKQKSNPRAILTGGTMTTTTTTKHPRAVHELPPPFCFAVKQTRLGLFSRSNVLIHVSLSPFPGLSRIPEYLRLQAQKPGNGWGNSQATQVSR